MGEDRRWEERVGEERGGELAVEYGIRAVEMSGVDGMRG